MNMVALVDGQPKPVQPEGQIVVFLEHRREVVTRRTMFELRKARERGHMLEGLAVALANIDEFIETIKNAPTPPVRQGRADEQELGFVAGGEMLAAPRAAARPTGPGWSGSPVRHAARWLYRSRTPRPGESCRCACSA